MTTTPTQFISKKEDSLNQQKLFLQQKSPCFLLKLPKGISECKSQEQKQEQDSNDIRIINLKSNLENKESQPQLTEKDFVLQPQLTENDFALQTQPHGNDFALQTQPLTKRQRQQPIKSKIKKCDNNNEIVIVLERSEFEDTTLPKDITDATPNNVEKLSEEQKTLIFETLETLNQTNQTSQSLSTPTPSTHKPGKTSRDYTLNELKNLCKQHELSTSGTKSILFDRLAQKKIFMN